MVLSLKILDTDKMKIKKQTCDYITPNADGMITRKVLGIIMNEKADFTDHINSVCSKVTQKFGWILRTFINRDFQ